MNLCENGFERHAIYFAMSHLLPKCFRSLEDLTNFWLSYQLFQSLLAIGSVSEIGSPREIAQCASGSAFASSLLILDSSLHYNRTQALLEVTASITAVLVSSTVQLPKSFGL